MAKSEKIKVTVEQVPEANSTIKIKPVSVGAATLSNERSIEVPDGHVYIVGIDASGNEKPNSGFFYPEKSYRKIYSDESKYLVKKKATK